MCHTSIRLVLPKWGRLLAGIGMAMGGVVGVGRGRGVKGGLRLRLPILGVIFVRICWRLVIIRRTGRMVAMGGWGKSTVDCRTLLLS